MSTAPRPPARFAPHATATASSSLATSTTRTFAEARTAAMSFPIHVSGTEAARVTPASSRPRTIAAAPLIVFASTVDSHAMDLGGGLDRFDDEVVAGAPAEIAREHLADLVGRRIGMLL